MLLAVSIWALWLYLFLSKRVAITRRHRPLGSFEVGRPAFGEMIDRMPSSSRAKTCEPSLS